MEIGTSEEPTAQLGIDLTLENPTGEPIQLDTYDYSVIVNASEGRSRWSGKWSALRTLPAGRTIEMTIPAVVPYTFSEAPELATWRVSGSISYKAPGRWAQILFDTGFRRPEHGFSGRGTSIGLPTAEDQPEE